VPDWDYRVCIFMMMALGHLILPAAPVASQSLVLEIRNINFNDTEPAFDSPTGYATIDTPGYIKANAHEAYEPEKIISPATAAIIASERLVSPTHPATVMVELNLARQHDKNGTKYPLPDRFLLRLRLQNAVFDHHISGDDIIRSGAFDDGHFNADTLGLTGADGTSYLELLVDDRSAVSQGDFGLLLPLRITKGHIARNNSCNPVELTVELFSAIGFPGPQPIAPPTNTILLTCQPALNVATEQATIKIDHGSDFKQFRDTADEGQRTAHLGKLTFSLRPHLFDPEQRLESPDRDFGFDDIERYRIELAFENLQGIKAVRAILDDQRQVHGEMDRNTGRVTISIPGTDFYSITHAAGLSGQTAKSKTAYKIPITIEIDSFEPKKAGKQYKDKSLIYGPISEQTVLIVNHSAYLKNPCKDKNDMFQAAYSTATQPARYCRIDFPLSEIGTLVRTGETFGPFDWVFNAASPASSFFRITNIPHDILHGSAIRQLEGKLLIENSSNGDALTYADPMNFAFDLDFSTPGKGENGSFLIGPMMIREILLQNGVPTNFGTADLTFVFHLNSEDTSPDIKSTGLDVDRLVRSNRRLVPYNDNSNDRVSTYAVSGDTLTQGPPGGSHDSLSR